MNNRHFTEQINAITKKDPRFHSEAYIFISKAVSHTIEELGRANSPNKHITGRELLKGLLSLAINEFGPLAAEVLSGWGIEKDTDIGQIVFNMVDHKLLSKSENDSIEDFNTGLNIKKYLTDYFLKDQPKSTSNTNDLLIE